MSEARNLVLAVVASVAVMVGWRFVYDKVLTKESPQQREVASESLIPEVVDVAEYRPRADAVNSVPRVGLGNSNVLASISLKGALVDDVSLKKYQVSTDKHSENVVLMSPEGTQEDSIVEFGWIDPKHSVKVPDKSTLWEVEQNSAADGDGESHTTLRWDNGQGLVFRLKFSLDRAYMFSVSQEVENSTGEDLHLAYYGRINKAHAPDGKSYWISHEGAIGSFGRGLQEWTYKDLQKENSIRVAAHEVAGSHWIGLADKYWFAALVPSSGGGKLAFRAKHIPRDDVDHFQVDFSRSYGLVPAGGKAEATTQLFIGAKELAVLDDYRSKLNIPLFDKAVDFGILYFITKPVFRLLQYFHKVVGNFGLAIIMLTISIKLVVFPLASKSYVSMFKLKKLQPEISRIKELYKTDDVRIGKEISSLFRKHGVSPVSGFLPILVQIPVFFALYKVLFVTIEMRHAPLCAWIQDLSSQDTANLLNLFGLLQFDPPVCIGVLPIILGVTMVLQQKLNQQDQAAHDPYGIMKFLPYVFVFIFSSFPAGLVLYWICSNVITILQQLFVRRFIFDRRDLVNNSA
ncbi:inner membrane protein translocase component YidC [Anaplasma centrale str. Israel]|uniref:Membrane protein insertase YidC n=1 Tax=Anaplasma centrale (strain Israel) TaxID=574556 RepID=D1ASB9_ANACI|nr:membrane protein insertase YidC [Anaplasma centrale]ACZ49372.1 inner membrane protein translocase component YidC [Anaplasma centrale str. Israel]